jgi:hypothetical protein
MFRRQTASSERAERRLLRYLDECEAMERAAADASYRQACGVPLPHIAAAATVLRAHRLAAGGNAAAVNDGGAAVAQRFAP